MVISCKVPILADSLKPSSSQCGGKVTRVSLNSEFKKKLGGTLFSFANESYLPNEIIYL